MSKEKKHTEGNAESEFEFSPNEDTDMDSKYRLVLLAAKRSKQLQKGKKGRVFVRKNERDIKSLGVPGTIGVSRIRSAIREVAKEALKGQSN